MWYLNKLAPPTCDYRLCRPLLDLLPVLRRWFCLRRRDCCFFALRSCSRSSLRWCKTCSRHALPTWRINVCLFVPSPNVRFTSPTETHNLPSLAQGRLGCEHSASLFTLIPKERVVRAKSSRVGEGTAALFGTLLPSERVLRISKYNGQRIILSGFPPTISCHLIRRESRWQPHLVLDGK